MVFMVQATRIQSAKTGDAAAITKLMGQDERALDSIASAFLERYELSTVSCHFEQGHFFVLTENGCFGFPVEDLSSARRRAARRTPSASVRSPRTPPTASSTRRDLVFASHATTPPGSPSNRRPSSDGYSQTDYTFLLQVCDSSCNPRNWPHRHLVTQRCPSLCPQNSCSELKPSKDRWGRNLNPGCYSRRRTR